MTSEAPVPSMAKLALACVSRVRALGVDQCHTLISCSKTKGGHREAARHLYTSPLYRKSVTLTERWAIPFSIMSAKYGLLDPDEIIEPYELTLKQASKKVKIEWARQVHKQLRSFRHKTLLILAGDDYLSPLLQAAEGPAAFEYFAPLQGLSLGTRLAFLNEAIRLENRRKAIANAYGLFERLIRTTGFCRLREVLSKDLPTHGVYFFFDDHEPTVFSNTIPRLVRVGTHGVSLGSVATLRNRLRTHFGTRAGRGNHRSSVFRLHVGRAIIERERLSNLFANWGKGQSADREITNAEADMEKKVSDYIGNLRVLFIPAHDSAGTGSIRATIEKQFIAMFTEHMCPLENSSNDWLGRFSDKQTIRETGLWNVRDVGEPYDSKFLPFLESYMARKNKK